MGYVVVATKMFFEVLAIKLGLHIVDFKISLFRSKWFDSRQDVKQDHHGYLSRVNLSLFGHHRNLTLHNFQVVLKREEDNFRGQRCSQRRRIYLHLLCPNPKDSKS